MFLLWETEHGKSWVKVLLEPSLILEAQKMVYRLQGAGEVPRDTRTPSFRCEEWKWFAMMSVLWFSAFFSVAQNKKKHFRKKEYLVENCQKLA